MEIKRYTKDDKAVWDKFVCESKNGTFLFCRNFMEYHKDRFVDHSLLFYHKKKLLAILPAHIQADSFCTHMGVSYGGLVMSKAVSASLVLEIFDLLITHLKYEKIETIIYKVIPHIYHQLPAEEDLYALFRHKAELYQRQISSTIDLNEVLPYSRFRRTGLRKAEENQLTIYELSDLSAFWNILTINLGEKHQTQPVHTLEEITLLKKLFPKEISLFEARNKEGKTIAGCLTFNTPTVVHIQYIASNTEGKQVGAVDLLVHHIIEKAKSDNKRYFDYGVSTEKGGAYLNENLIAQKEGFGARATICDTYILKI